MVSHFNDTSSNWLSCFCHGYDIEKMAKCYAWDYVAGFYSFTYLLFDEIDEQAIFNSYLCLFCKLFLD
jgi:hypothetical protein